MGEPEQLDGHIPESQSNEHRKVHLLDDRVPKSLRNEYRKPNTVVFCCDSAWMVVSISESICDK